MVKYLNIIILGPENELNNPEILLNKLQETFPKFQFIQEKDLKIDGSGMKNTIEDLKIFENEKNN